MIPRFIGVIKDGKFIFADKTKWLNYINTLEGEAVLTVKKITKRTERSINQNRYYFGIPLKLISQHTGYTVDELHEILKFKFLKEHTDLGERIKSTTELSTVEFEQYLSDIRKWARVELGCYVPLPNEVEY